MPFSEVGLQPFLKHDVAVRLIEDGHFVRERVEEDGIHEMHFVIHKIVESAGDSGRELQQFGGLDRDERHGEEGAEFFLQLLLQLPVHNSTGADLDQLRECLDFVRRNILGSFPLPYPFLLFLNFHHIIDMALIQFRAFPNQLSNTLDFRVVSGQRSVYRVPPPPRIQGWQGRISIQPA